MNYQDIPNVKYDPKLSKDDYEYLKKDVIKVCEDNIKELDNNKFSAVTDMNNYKNECPIMILNIMVNEIGFNLDELLRDMPSESKELLDGEMDNATKTMDTLGIDINDCTYDVIMTRFKYKTKVGKVPISVKIAWGGYNPLIVVESKMPIEADSEREALEFIRKYLQPAFPDVLNYTHIQEGTHDVFVSRLCYDYKDAKDVFDALVKVGKILK